MSLCDIDKQAATEISRLITLHLSCQFSGSIKYDTRVRRNLTVSRPLFVFTDKIAYSKLSATSQMASP